MNPETYQTQPQQLNVKLLAVFGLTAIIFIAGLVFLLRPRSIEPTKEFKLARTNLQLRQNFGYLRGPDLYAYNGAAFYKKNLANDNLTVLHSGSKLPNVSNMFWANDKGALMNFDGSFLLSRVEKTLLNNNSFVESATEGITWYMDFKTGELTQASKQPVTLRLAHYDQKANGFYFVPDYYNYQGPEVEGIDIYSENLLEIRFFDISRGRSKVLARNLDLSDIKALTSCPGYKVCLIGRGIQNPQSERLYGLNENDQLKELINSGGRLFGTSRNDMYVAVGLGEDESTDTTEHSHDSEEHIPEDVVYSEEPAVLHKLQGSESIELGFDVGSSDLVTGFYGELEYFALTPQQSISGEDDDLDYYIAGRLDPSFSGNPEVVEKPLLFEDESSFDEGLLSAVSYSISDTLLTDIDGNQLLFTPGKPETLFPADKTAAEMIVKDCSESAVKTRDYFEEEKLFRIYFNDNDNFENNIKRFSQCLGGSDFSQVATYNFYFGALSSLNGRIITD